MNKIYKLKFNRQRSENVAVSEISLSAGKTQGTTTSPQPLSPRSVRPLAALVSALLFSLSSVSYAASLPQHGQIVAGEGSISTASKVMTIRQASNKMAVEWHSFDIGQQYGVRFVQPDSSAVALNRVTGGNPSQIMGSLSANGRVFLVNPNGVIFGKNASVNTAGFVASARNLSVRDFINGCYSFSGGADGAKIINQGNLTATPGGFIMLAADQVSNQGSIHTPQGKTVLAAGQTVTLQLDQAGLLGVKVSGDTLNALAENKGLISASGGQVYLTARGKAMLFNTVVNNSGTIKASGLINRNGYIVLDGGDSGVVTQSGTLNADNTSGKGGRITVSGHYVHLAANSKTSARGGAGGGEVYIGGGWQGKDAAIGNAHSVVMNKTATVDVSATLRGKGGTAVLWSERYTDFRGRIFARGGVLSGDGGRVETSSRGNLQAFGRVDAAAPRGKGGNWLLDPVDVEIVAGSTDSGFSTFSNNIFTPTAGGAKISVSSIETQLNNGVSVTVRTSDPTNNQPDVAGQLGNITVSTSINKSGGADAALTLQADHDILFKDNSQINSDKSAGKLTLNLLAKNKIDTGNNFIASLNGGDFHVAGYNGGKTALHLTDNASIRAGHIHLNVTNGLLINNSTLQASTGLIIYTGSANNILTNSTLNGSTHSSEENSVGVFITTTDGGVLQLNNSTITGISTGDSAATGLLINGTVQGAGAGKKAELIGRVNSSKASGIAVRVAAGSSLANLTLTGTNLGTGDVVYVTGSEKTTIITNVTLTGNNPARLSSFGAPTSYFGQGNGVVLNNNITLTDSTVIGYSHNPNDNMAGVKITTTDGGVLQLNHTTITGMKTNTKGAGIQVSGNVQGASRENNQQSVLTGCMSGVGSGFGVLVTEGSNLLNVTLNGTVSTSDSGVTLVGGEKGITLTHVTVLGNRTYNTSANQGSGVLMRGNITLIDSSVHGVTGSVHNATRYNAGVYIVTGENGVLHLTRSRITGTITGEAHNAAAVRINGTVQGSSSAANEKSVINGNISNAYRTAGSDVLVVMEGSKLVNLTLEGRTWGNGDRSAVSIMGGVKGITLANVTVNGDSQNTGISHGVVISGNVTLTDSLINGTTDSGNANSSGVKIDTGDGGTLQLNHSNITGNSTSESAATGLLVSGNVQGNSTEAGKQSVLTGWVTQAKASGNGLRVGTGSTLANLTLHGNSAGTADAVSITGGEKATTFTGVVINGNATGGGSGVVINNNVTLTDSTVNGTTNSTDGNNAGVKILTTDGGTLQLNHSTVTGNSTGEGAVAGLLISGNVQGNSTEAGKLSVLTGVVSNDKASGNALQVSAGSTLLNLTLNGDTKGTGDGVSVSGDEKATTLTNTTINGNNTGSRGMGANISGAVTLTNATVNGNVTGTGNAINIDGGSYRVTLNTITLCGTTSGSGSPLRLQKFIINGISKLTGIINNASNTHNALDINFNLTNSQLNGSTSGTGHGVNIDGGSQLISLQQVRVTGNATGGSGVVLNNNITLTDSSVNGTTSSTHASSAGVKILTTDSGTLQLNHSTVTGNNTGVAAMGLLIDGRVQGNSTEAGKQSVLTGLVSNDKGVGNALRVNAGSTLLNLTLQGESKGAGNGVSVTGGEKTTTLTNTTINGNNTGSGSGVLLSNNVTLTDSSVNGTTSSTDVNSAGVKILTTDSGTLQLNHSTVTGNSTGGGAATGLLIDGRVQGNSTEAGKQSVLTGMVSNDKGVGNALQVSAGSTLLNLTLQGESKGAGSGVSVSGDEKATTLTNTTINGNNTGSGTGVKITGAVTLTDVTVNANVTGAGNAINIDGGSHNVALNNITLCGTTSGGGSPLRLQNVTFKGASKLGGIINNASNTHNALDINFSLTNSQLNGTTSGTGNGVNIDGGSQPVTLQQVTITGNTTGNGNGVAINNNVTLTDSTISASSTGSGAALAFSGTPVAHVVLNKVKINGKQTGNTPGTGVLIHGVNLQMDKASAGNFSASSDAGSGLALRDTNISVSDSQDEAVSLNATSRIGTGITTDGSVGIGGLLLNGSASGSGTGVRLTGVINRLDQLAAIRASGGNNGHGVVINDLTVNPPSTSPASPFVIYGEASGSSGVAVLLRGNNKLAGSRITGNGSAGATGIEITGAVSGGTLQGQTDSGTGVLFTSGGSVTDSQVTGCASGTGTGVLFDGVFTLYSTTPNALQLTGHAPGGTGIQLTDNSELTVRDAENKVLNPAVIFTGHTATGTGLAVGDNTKTQGVILTGEASSPQGTPRNPPLPPEPESGGGVLDNAGGEGGTPADGAGGSATPAQPESGSHAGSGSEGSSGEGSGGEGGGSEGNGSESGGGASGGGEGSGNTSGSSDGTSGSAPGAQPESGGNEGGADSSAPQDSGSLPATPAQPESAGGSGNGGNDSGGDTSSSSDSRAPEAPRPSVITSTDVSPQFRRLRSTVDHDSQSQQPQGYQPARLPAIPHNGYRPAPLTTHLQICAVGSCQILHLNQIAPSRLEISEGDTAGNTTP